MGDILSDWLWPAWMVDPSILGIHVGEYVNQSYHPSNLRIRALVAEAIQRIGHRAAEPRLEDALLSIYLATGAQRALAQGAVYRAALLRDQEEAIRHGATLIGTPHLTLALCALTDTPASPIRGALPFSLQKVAEAIRTALGEGRSTSRTPTAYTLPLQHVLQLAAEVAGATRGQAIEMLHCWIALLEEEQGLLSQILAQGEVDRLAVLEQMEEPLQRGTKQGSARHGTAGQRGGDHRRAAGPGQSPAYQARRRLEKAGSRRQRGATADSSVLPSCPSKPPTPGGRMGRGDRRHYRPRYACFTPASCKSSSAAPCMTMRPVSST